jgi:tripartite ATP-independent transporter DctM subunit
MSFSELLGLIMLIVLIGVIFIGFPIAFTLLFLALVFGYVGLGARVFDLAYLQTLGLMKEEVLAAVPLFIFMGFIVEKAGLMERLFRAFRDLLAPVRGALYMVVVLTAMVFGMATGIVGAAVTVLGIMAGPMMIKSGYDPKLSAGAITAGGTLGILVPPSVMLIVMGPVMGVSVTKLYAAAIIPAFVLASLYIVYCLAHSFVNPKLGPPVPREERAASMSAVLKEVFFGMVPLAALITATLGSILGGLATPTEAAGLGASGAILLALAYRKLTFSAFQKALLSTLTTASMVLFLAAASNVFGAVFARLGTASWITNAMIGLPLPPFATLTMIVILIFLLGWPFEWPAIILVFLPIFYPVVAALNFDLVWFGAVVAVTMQTAFLSPPVAMSAYYLKQVVPQWGLGTIYRGMAKFMVIQMVAVALVMVFPQLSLWLPNHLFETRVTAPADTAVPLPAPGYDAEDDLERGDRLE